MFMNATVVHLFRLFKTLYAYVGELHLGQVVQNLWAWTSHPKGDKNNVRNHKIR